MESRSKVSDSDVIRHIILEKSGLAAFQGLSFLHLSGVNCLKAENPAIPDFRYGLSMVKPLNSGLSHLQSLTV
jgi:hypothetical protein